MSTATIFGMWIIDVIVHDGMSTENDKRLGQFGIFYKARTYADIQAMIDIIYSRYQKKKGETCNHIRRFIALLLLELEKVSQEDPRRIRLRIASGREVPEEHYRSYIESWQRQTPDHFDEPDEPTM